MKFLVNNIKWKNKEDKDLPFFDVVEAHCEKDIKDQLHTKHGSEVISLDYKEYSL